MQLGNLNQELSDVSVCVSVSLITDQQEMWHHPTTPKFPDFIRNLSPQGNWLLANYSSEKSWRKTLVGLGESDFHSWPNQKAKRKVLTV